MCSRFILFIHYKRYFFKPIYEVFIFMVNEYSKCISLW